MSLLKTESVFSPKSYGPGNYYSQRPILTLKDNLYAILVYVKYDGDNLPLYLFTPINLFTKEIENTMTFSGVNQYAGINDGFLFKINQQSNILMRYKLSEQIIENVYSTDNNYINFLAVDPSKSFLWLIEQSNIYKLKVINLDTFEIMSEAALSGGIPNLHYFHIYNHEYSIVASYSKNYLYTMDYQGNLSNFYYTSNRIADVVTKPEGVYFVEISGSDSTLKFKEINGTADYDIGLVQVGNYPKILVLNNDKFLIYDSRYAIINRKDGNIEYINIEREGILLGTFPFIG